MTAQSNLPILSTKKLTVANIFNFPPNTQKVILVLLDLEKATVKQISKEVKYPIGETLTICRELVNSGFIGEDCSNGEIVFFCNI
jgi:hypothetical protein